MHLQIFFAFSCALALVVTCTIALWLWNNDNNRHLKAFATFSELVEQNLPPASAPRAAQSLAIDSWIQRTRTRFSLYTADGSPLSRPLAPPLSFPLRVASGGLFDDWYGTRFVWQLKDKRVLVIQLSSDRQKRPWLFILLLLGMAASVVLVSFPVIRRLTARLESLQQSVESLGKGNLDARVQVTGRDEVAQPAASFNRAAAQIEQLVQSQKTMLANASHELRAPLMRIQMAAALLVQKESPASRELRRSVGELDALVEEILTLSRLTQATGVITGDFRPADITAIAAEECASAQIELCAEHVLAEVDARLIRRLLRNLIENAQRYAGSDISVVLRLVDREHFTFEVKDRGPGIPEAERERIFEPFYRLSSSGNGCGLGLALVRSIAEYHRGTLAVRNRRGGGACFQVCIPVAVT
ncbi:HAMP domain-containing sensor histidine kinase [Raoultella sp. Ech2A]|uniref:HAMP domain-containing sensor histidine kinase n=1 Tax=Raoultella sp. Ech2A TaxID=2996539 RepID=UPI0024BF163F|nr:HAMP domain-containing sensor histidine kinase [Raoultella sp. Ech2A]MDJ1655121.1 HAMP domain-containing sensor histidine kinase [Raoultella sp. Ech2A]